jgi:hypothetical protein
MSKLALLGHQDAPLNQWPTEIKCFRDGVSPAYFTLCLLW